MPESTRKSSGDHGKRQTGQIYEFNKDAAKIVGQEFSGENQE